MEISDEIALCNQHYQRWKDIALTSPNIEGSRRCLEKAFFWLELQTAFIILFSIEKTNKNDQKIKEKMIFAKARLCKKLADYAKQTLNEIEI